MVMFGGTFESLANSGSSIPDGVVGQDEVAFDIFASYISKVF